MAKFIEFQQIADQLYHGRPAFNIVNKQSGNNIGHIAFDPLWLQYTAAFKYQSIWSHDCLADVSKFIRELPLEEP